MNRPRPTTADQRAAFRRTLDAGGFPPFDRAPLDCTHYDAGERFAVVETAHAYGCRLCGKLWTSRTASGAYQPPPNLCRGCGDAAVIGAILCAVCWSIVPNAVRVAFVDVRRGGTRAEVRIARAAAVRAARDARGRSR